MKRKFGMNCFAFGILILVVLFAMPVFAQRGSTPGSMAHTPENRPSPNTYGTSGLTNLWIPASAFVPHSSDVTWVRTGPGGGAISKTGGSPEGFWAPLNLPNGADVSEVELHYTDTATDDAAFYCITQYDIDNNYVTNETCVDVPAGTPGQTTTLFDPFPNNNIINNRHMNVIHVFNDNATPSEFFFHGVRIGYKLQVSPAPGTATFSDVPLSHPFFQHIEALAASGITTGYGDGTYRPDNYVTRAALAAFLARALGLHWPN